MRSRPALVKRSRLILAVGTAVLVPAVVSSLAGQPLIGFRYSVLVNNLASECPSTVVGVDGSRITLDDGRVVVVKGPSERSLRAELTECENRVRFDPADGSLHTMRRVRFCGFDRPESRPLITIPLRAANLRQFSSRPFAAVREIRPPSGG
jgi:hypothetical protein